MSSCHGNKISGSQQTVVLSVHGCSQEQNGLPIVFFYRWTIEMAVSVKKRLLRSRKIATIGKVTSHFSSL